MCFLSLPQCAIHNMADIKTPQPNAFFPPPSHTLVNALFGHSSAARARGHETCARTHVHMPTLYKKINLIKDHFLPSVYVASKPK